jgi:hypothetical protein
MRGGADGVLHHLQAERPTAGEYKVDSAATDDEVTAIPHQALDEFRKEFPNISLFDGVTVVYEKD